MFVWNPQTGSYVDPNWALGNYNLSSPANPYSTTPQPVQNDIQLPRQQIITANGKQSIDKIKMYPGSSAIIADTTSNRVWFCFSDGLGNVSSTPYKIFVDEEFTKQQEVPQAPQKELPDTSHLNDLESRISQLEGLVLEMEDKINAKSNTSVAKSK